MKKTIENLFKEEELFYGRMIFPSKFFYTKMKPNNLVVFNAKVYDSKKYNKQKDCEPDWVGDLDLSLDIKKIYRVTRKYGGLTITYEDGDKIMELFKTF